MIQQNRVTRFIFILLTVICSVQAFAGVEPYQNQLKGKIKKGDSLIVKDEKFRNVLFDWNEITNRTVKNFLSFQLTHDTPVVLNKAFTCELDLKVEYFSTPDQAEPISINSVKLKVTFTPDTGGTYKAKDVYEFSNGYYVKVTVNSINSPELGDDIPPVLQLTSQIVIDRKYAFHPEKKINFTGSIDAGSTSASEAQTEGNERMMALAWTGPAGSTQLNNYFLNLYWDPIQGAEEYDIEWAVFDELSEFTPLINQVLGNQVTDDNTLDVLFRNNATRITTEGNAYNITMVYNAKYIMVRMRQVEYLNGYRKEDNWDYRINSAIAIWPIQTWHEQNLNWQYAATFAEQGKKKEIVNYYDGASRNRQMVTINNSDNIAIVQENVYDEFGRAAASILPAPTLDNKFHFYPKFNRNSSGDSYNYSNLGIDNVNSATCEPLPQVLNDASGAANYYSSQNSFLSLNSSDSRYRNYNKYIPKASGYPMSVTQFTNDNTGRVRVSGGVGPAFQPGATARHTTKYYYGKPESYELDRLFGNDVGYAHHYQKNLVVDPNGQISISYINASGKTIATALTGKTPDGMDALPSKPEEKQETFTILQPQQFVFDATALSLKARTSYLNSVVNSPATFNYNIQELIYAFQGSVNASPFQICSKCNYDLTIRITNDCGDLVYPANSNEPPIHIGSLSGDCNSAGNYTDQFDALFQEIGEYYISFEFKLDRDAMEEYTTTYINQRLANNSLKSEMEFILDYLNSTEFNNCFECNSCEEALGTEVEFTQAIIGILEKNGYVTADFTPELYSFISGKYNSLHSQCIAMRATCMTSSCSKYEKAMLEDVSPGGQYAMYSSNPFTLIEPEVNVLIGGNLKTAFPQAQPGTALWLQDAFVDENGNTVSPHDPSFTVEMLVKYWDDNWAPKFLQFHPEKCKLDFCNQNSNYYLWDDQVQQLIKKASDIPSIPGNNGATYSYSDGAWLTGIDPFFTSGPGASYRVQFEADLRQFSTLVMQMNISGAQTKGLTQVIDYLLYCANIDGNTNTGTVGDSWNSCIPVPSCRVPNKEWDQYKEMYFQLKQKYYQLVRNTTSCATRCTVGTPYTPGGACASVKDFSIERVIGSNACEAPGTYPVRVTYRGTASRLMSVALYMPSEFDYLYYRPQSVTFGPGYSEYILCVSDTIPFSSIRIKSVTCYTNPTPPACNGISGTVNLTGTVKQLASNIFQEVAPSGVQTTYYVLPGRADQPPNEANYCDGNTVSMKQFYNCFKLQSPNSSVPFQFSNVWVIGCSRDVCANAPVYNVDYQVGPYKFYSNGTYYYIKLSNGGGATPECAYTPVYQQCIKVQVWGSETPIVFSNASINTCEACSPNMDPIQVKFQLSDNPITYVGMNDEHIYVYPFTTPDFNPGSECGATPTWQSCVRFTGKGVGGVYSNATIITCGGDPCANAYTYPSNGMINSNTFYVPWGTIYFYQGEGDQEPTSSNCPGIWEAAYFGCVKMDVFGTIYTFQNVWGISCLPDEGGGGETVAKNSSRESSKTIYTRLVKSKLADTTWLHPYNATTHNYKNNTVQTGASATEQLRSVAFAIPCSEIYQYKKSRFPEIDYSASLNAQNLLDVQNENNALITGQIKTNCEAQADKWMTQLADCLASYSPNVKDQLRTKLIEVCTNGGDLDHPYGASTVRPDYTGTGYVSFKQAIQSVLGLGAFTMTCNPWLIDEPHPYEPKQQSVSKMLSVTNAGLCTKLQQLHAGYSGSDFYTYLKNLYGDAMNLTSTQLAMLEKSCNNCRFLLEEDIPLPVFMEPGTQGCLTATEYNNAKDALIAEMGSNLDGNHVNYPDVLANFMNHRFGFSMAAFRYQEYELAKQANSAAILCNNLPYTEVEVEKYVCLKSLVQMAITNGHRDFVAYIEEEKRRFRINYVATCSQAAASTQVTTRQQTYHYTLYYYDQAGNIIRTITPDGVRFLSDEEMKFVDDFRKLDDIDCATLAAEATEDKTYLFNTFSAQMSSTRSLEMWINGNTDSREVRFVTPDNKYMYQAAIKDSKLWVELYTLAPGANGAIEITLTNHATAQLNTAGIAPWSHLVVQANNFVSDPWTVYLNNRQLTLLPDASAPAYPFAWEIEAGYTLPAEEISQLKHLRLYNELIGASAIALNYVNPCRAPEGTLRVKPTPLIIWGRLNGGACNAVETRLVNNRGALQVTGDLGQGQHWLPNITNNFTVEFWVNPQGTRQWQQQSTNNTSGVTGQQYLIVPVWGGNAATGRAGMGVSIGTNGVSVYEHADNYLPPLLSYDVPLNGWHHIAVVYNNKVPTLYIDGAWAANGLQSQKDWVSPGYTFSTNGYGIMKGGVDEVRIWSTSRTAAEISANYNQSICATTSGLVGYWPMSSTDGALPKDISPSHLLLTLTNNNYNYTAGTSAVQDLLIEEVVPGVFPRHRLATSYAFNSSNKAVQQKSPDGGHTYFWYDMLVRLVASQNEEQRFPYDNLNPGKYSYTKYEPVLGRITEIGEKLNGTTLPAPGFLDQSTVDAFQSSGSNTQITSTVYDKLPTGNGVTSGLVQENLRKRVSASFYRETDAGPILQGSYYSYDLMGNVKSVWQQVDGLGLKKTDYEYDLAGGKTSFVRYQHGQNDQFYYAYKYDAENRLIEAYTSTTAAISERGSILTNGKLDALYKYYYHGPLARTELGSEENKVQGLDYAYTLQGWIKGVNGHKLDAVSEIGNDGITQGDVARDAIAYTLGYYKKDYEAIGAGVSAFSMEYLPDKNDISGSELFNGNISHTTVAINKFRNSDPVGYTYHYDQLNRLKKMRYHPISSSTSTWDINTKDPLDVYGENITYDGDGNIETYMRNGPNSVNMPLAMDNLVYNYTPKVVDPVINQPYRSNNQLQLLKETDPNVDGNYSKAFNGTEDLDNQTNSQNYKYDKIGNLKFDDAAHISNITWTTYGKIKSVTKNVAGTLTEIEYAYDAAGNRVRKVVKENQQITTTWYARDAQGNSIAVYSDKQNGQPGIWWQEQYLYGGSRLGMWKPDINIATTAGTGQWGILGKKQYELANYLGNVLVTITDKIIGVPSSGNGSSIDHYEADVVSAQDYYPFGMIQPGRSFNTSGYRYGFSGKENDNEIKGDGNSIDFGDRVYDPRIGRWLSVDPLQQKYASYSTYNYALNSPVLVIDPVGQDVGVSITRNPNGGGTIVYSSTIYVGGPGCSPKDQVKMLTTNWGFAKDNFKGEYKDESGNVWKVEVQMNFKVAEAKDIARIKQATQPGNENLLYFKAGGGSVAYSVKNGNAANKAELPGEMWSKDPVVDFHEVLHLYGLGDYYYEDISPVDDKGFRIKGEVPLTASLVGYADDWMGALHYDLVELENKELGVVEHSAGDVKRKKFNQSHIDNLAKSALNQSAQKGDKFKTNEVADRGQKQGRSGGPRSVKKSNIKTKDP
jgi:RHS repeat-associated protein